MKSNELFKKIHSGEIEEDTMIEVLKKNGEHIAFISYADKKLNWVSGEFDTSYLCNIDTEFKVVQEDWKIKKINTKNEYVGNRIEIIEKKVNEIIDNLNKKNDPLPF